ncbi:MAG TPA: hypothetical protein VF444_07930 [Pseudonocardiaceae bacterium]
MSDPLSNPASQIALGGAAIGKAADWLASQFTGSSDSSQPAQAAATGPIKPEDAATFAQKVQKQSADAQALKDAANNGKFSIHPDAADAMIKAFQYAQDQWAKNRGVAVRLADKYMLGSTPGAKVISTWNQQIGQQLVTAFDQLKGVYQDQIDAYTKAKQNYEAVEQQQKDSFSGRS